MYKNTHKRITSEICNVLNISGELKEILLKSVIIPDEHRENILEFGKNKVYWRHENHHKVNKEKILDYLWKARICFLASDYKSAMRYLGIVLHYIQDICMCSGRLHNEREELLKNVSLKNKNPKVKELRTYSDFERLIYSITPKRSPTSVINSAYYYSLVITKNLLTKYPLPQDLINKYGEVKKEYEENKKISFGMMLIFTITSIIVKILIPLAISFILLYLILYQPYKKLINLEKDINWFGENSE